MVIFHIIIFRLRFRNLSSGEGKGMGLDGRGGARKGREILKTFTCSRNVHWRREETNHIFLIKLISIQMTSLPSYKSNRVLIQAPFYCQKLQKIIKLQLEKRT